MNNPITPTVVRVRSRFARNGFALLVVAVIFVVVWMLTSAPVSHGEPDKFVQSLHSAWLLFAFVGVILVIGILSGGGGNNDYDLLSD